MNNTGQLVLLDTQPSEKEKELFGTWAEVLKGTIKHPKMKALSAELKKEASSSIIYPDKKNWFRALRETPYDDLKVVIIGQDPYFNGYANGLAFGTDNKKSSPKSLKVILKASKSCLNCPPPSDYSLVSWAKQGILLLNRTLTVKAGEANSHKYIGWSWFVNKVIKETNHKNPVYLLWGGTAQEIDYLIKNKEMIIKSEHPAYSLYEERDWDFNNCFEKTNELLTKTNRNQIKW